jgi:NAD(P)-dependent dehydrogenase (short-subunit alcohol dehydrogenase family)
MDFTGKQIVVTGGTGALGGAVVTKLLSAGAKCVVSYRHDTEAQKFSHRNDPNVRLIATGDLSSEEAVEKLYRGQIPWASIHLAGGFAMGDVTETDKAALMVQLESNLISCFLCCRAAVKTMRAKGKNGRIVNVASRQALEPRSGAGASAYTIAKTGVAALTIALAEEVAKHGILVNAVAPSIMDTEANRKAMPKADFTRWPKIEEVAETILFLASPENTVTRGAIVSVYGKA